MCLESHLQPSVTITVAQHQNKAIIWLTAAVKPSERRVVGQPILTNTCICTCGIGQPPTPCYYQTLSFSPMLSLTKQLQLFVAVETTWSACACVCESCVELCKSGLGGADCSGRQHHTFPTLSDIISYLCVVTWVCIVVAHRITWTVCYNWVTVWEDSTVLQHESATRRVCSNEHDIACTPTTLAMELRSAQRGPCLDARLDAMLS